MQKQNELLLSAEDDFPAEASLCQQLTVLKTSQSYILLIIIAVCLSYYVTEIQKEQLCCALSGRRTGRCACLPDTFPIGFVSSALVLTALIFFFNLTCQPAGGVEESCAQRQVSKRNTIASLLVLLAALIRMADLLGIPQNNL